MADKKTLILGATPDTSRYANLAANRLVSRGHSIVNVGLKKGEVAGVAIEKPENIQPTAKEPSRTLLLLRHLADITDPGNLKREIDATIAYFQAR